MPLKEYLEKRTVKIGLAFLGLVASTIVTWCVTNYLNHSKPDVTIENVTFFYSFPRSNEKGYQNTSITFTSDLLKQADTSFWNRAYSLNQVFHLEQLPGDFLKDRNEMESQIDNYYQGVDLDISSFNSILSDTKNLSVDLLADQWKGIINNYLQENDETVVFLKWLENQKIIDFGISDAEAKLKIAPYLDGEGNIRVTQNSIFYSLQKLQAQLQNDFSKKEKLSFIYPLIEKITYLIVTENYPRLRDVFGTAGENAKKMGGQDKGIFDQIYKLTADRIAPYKKVSAVIRVFNNSEFIVALLKSCTLELKDSGNTFRCQFQCEIDHAETSGEQRSDSKSVSVTSGIIINPKSSFRCSLMSIKNLTEENLPKSSDPNESMVNKIDFTYKANLLEAQVNLKSRKRALGQFSGVTSPWMIVTKMN